MAFLDRMSKGWTIATTSFQVLKENKQLIVFPLLSGLSLIFIAGIFLTPLLVGTSFDIERFANIGRGVYYLLLFGIYLVNYFVVVFFNMALIHCVSLYFDGKKPSVSDGLRFSFSRIGVIFMWAAFAATVGTCLKVIQDNAGWVGKIITSILGFAWGVGTFFVVPFLAYEQLGPADAVKRSTDLMKQKWGESLGATFGFGAIQALAFVLLALVSLAASALVVEWLGIAIFALGMVSIMILSSTLNTIFVSAVYKNVTTGLNVHFNRQMLDGLFEEKR